MRLLRITFKNKPLGERFLKKSLDLDFSGTALASHAQALGSIPRVDLNKKALN